MPHTEEKLESPGVADLSYRAALLAEFHRRKGRNPRYSIRAYAKALGVSKTALADALANRRNLSRRSALRVAAKLSFPQNLVDQMLQDIREVCEGADDGRYLRVGDEVFSLIADWPHYAVLCLAQFQENLDDADWIAAKLDIPADVALVVRDRLCRLGLLESREGRLHRTTRGLTTTNDVPSEALREHQRQNLRLAEASLSRDPVSERELSSITMPIRRDSVPEAKRLIRHFKRRLARLLDCENPDAVYTLSLQLFPLTPRETTGALQ